MDELHLFFEYLAFSLSLASAYLYGHSKKWGPPMGLATSISFIVFGLVTGIYAAVLSNVVFIIVHVKNWRKAMSETEEFRAKEIAKAVATLTRYATESAESNGWHDKERTVNDFICLMHSELSEAFEGNRRNLPDEHIPHRSSLEVEMADLVLRAFDHAYEMGLDLAGAIPEKLNYNDHRPDHNKEYREKDPHGKQI